MKKKRRLILDKKFQIKFASMFTALSAVAVAVVIIVIALISMNNKRKLESVAENQKSLTTSQKDVLETMISISLEKSLDNVRILIPVIKKDVENNTNRLDGNIEVISQIIKSSNNLIIVLIIFVVIQSVVMFIILIKRSHRISGPLFLLNRYINDIKKGKSPEIRPLRENDDFKELINNFIEMVEILRKKKSDK